MVFICHHHSYKIETDKKLHFIQDLLYSLLKNLKYLGLQNKILLKRIHLMQETGDHQQRRQFNLIEQ